MNAVDWGSAGELGVALATVLSQNASLESLCLKTDGTNFSDKTGTVLAQALTQNTSLASCLIEMSETEYIDRLIVKRQGGPKASRRKRTNRREEKRSNRR